MAQIKASKKNKQSIYTTYREAKAATIRLGIKSRAEYQGKLLYKKDPRLPHNPEKQYFKKGWKNWYIFLGRSANRTYSSYHQAARAARKLKIKNYTEYYRKKLYKQDERLPARPDTVYKHKGWKSWQIFLGLPIPNFYKTYNAAKKAVYILKIVSKYEYKRKNRFKEDKKLPRNPDELYKGKGWKNWKEFVYPKYYPTYKEARNSARRLKATGVNDYMYLCYKEDPLLPSKPHKVYKNKGWKNWIDFLDLKDHSFYETYVQAKKAAKKLGIKTSKEYLKFKHYKHDKRLPSAPHYHYKNKGWVDWYDFLDIHGNPLYYYSFAKAKKLVHKLGINSITHYRKISPKEDKLPRRPDFFYKNKGWKNWNDFFGKSERKFYKTYREAEKAARKLKLKSSIEYLQCMRYKEDNKLPRLPRIIYKSKGWKNWRTFLGIPECNYYKTYNAAKKAVHKLKIISKYEYQNKKRYKGDSKLPREPYKFYKGKGWKNWKDFLFPKFYPTYKEAKIAAHRLKIGGTYEYLNFRYKEDPLLPCQPNIIYKNKGWKSWIDFLGLENKNLYKTYAQAKIAVKKLGIKSSHEYMALKYRKVDKRLPSAPWLYYQNKGWVDWYDFLGTSMK
jgi:hypothetical protein